MWILPKNYPLSSRFAQDMVESKEDLTLPGLNIESSLMWRSKPSPLRTWLTRWKTDSYLPHLFTRILKPSQRTSFETALTSSLAATRASRFQQQDSEREPMTQDIYGPTSLITSDQLDLFRCFFENVEGHISLGLSTVISDLEEDGYRATWGIFSAREVGAPHQRKRVYILGNSEHYGSSTSEIRGGASSTSNNTTQGQNEAIKSQRASQPDCGGDLSGAADMGHSQNNRCAGCRETIKRERSENHIKRPDQDLRWQSQRSSQTLADSEGKFSKRRIAEGVASWKPEEAIGDRGAFDPWPTPSAHEARLGYQDRSDTTKKGTQESLLTVVVNTAGGRSECPGHLNPEWVEWLMGVPTGWTELGCWETQ
jgi:hypothetical protein